MAAISLAVMQPSEPGSMLPRATTLTGTVADRFVILKLLGAGGMGQVYQAQDTKLKRIVAIKRMAPRLQQDERDRRRFLREAQQASALNHPNVAGIYDVIEDEGEVFLIMEYVEGTPLRALMQSHKAFTPDELFNLAAQGLEGLNAAHEKGILHGDIKPENIMLTPEGRVKVLDFGVARRFSLGDAEEGAPTVDTISGGLSGTPAYMAPEVLMQKPYDGRADLFSLGLVYYEMLGGQQPFETDSIAGTLASVLHKEPPPIEQINPKVPASVSAMVRTLLAKDPTQRYSTARDVLVDLRRVQQGEKPVFARGAVFATRKLKLGWKTASAVVAGAAVLTLAAFLLRGVMQHRPNGKAGSPSQSAGEKSPTLAVLPFTTIEGNPKLTAFGQGLVESVSARLSRLTADRGLEVIPAGSLQEKKATSLADARSQYGADLGLVVSLEESGPLLRVKYSLLNARSGAVVGGDSIAVPASDAFGVEDDVAQGTVKARRAGRA